MQSMPEQTSGDLLNPIRIREALIILLLDLSVVTLSAVNKLMEDGLNPETFFKNNVLKSFVMRLEQCFIEEIFQLELLFLP
ncbi:hypothetical protein OIU77_030338 [Salix suchowensis]|uniref:Uncharacterized protein n=1 Tax=Salix suchowensis TaxID=1278906 RepID=A0ABQ9BF29_9ROSI|nr:hypothetical protein OIU77_030338 [Salix suchowensis]